MSLASNTCWFATGDKLLNHTSESRTVKRNLVLFFNMLSCFQNITIPQDQQPFMHNVNITFLKLQRLCGLNTPESFGLMFTSYKIPP